MVFIAASLIILLLPIARVQAAEQLLVAYAGHNETVAPMWVGIETGLFKKKGLDVGMGLVPGMRF